MCADISFLVVLLSLSCLALLGQADNIFCYYSSFAYKRHGLGNFVPENVNPKLCTHLIYAFVDITPDGRDIQPFNKNDLGPEGLYARTMVLKEMNPALKILLAVGGWQVGSKPFIPMVESEENRRAWTDNVITYLRRHNFDGFDIDWEFPATRGSPPEDKYRFTKLLKGLYEAFQDESAKTGNTKLLLTLATASGTYYIDQSYEPDKIFHYIDFMLLMTYNYHGQWEKITGHHSGLDRHRDDPTTGEKSQLYQQWSIDYWLEVGVPKEKLIVGIPTYGMSFTLADPSNNGVRAPAIGGGTMGDYTRETGILAYYEVCMNLQNKGWNSVWIDDQSAPYAYSGDQWVGYENQKSIALKARNIQARGLAGAFVWSVEMDDFKGNCGEGKYPLLTTIQNVLGDGSHKAPTNDQSNAEPDREPEISLKTKKRNTVITSNPQEIPKLPSEEPTNPIVRRFRKKNYKGNVMNAAAASESKLETKPNSKTQTSEVVDDAAKIEHHGTWWLGNVWRRKGKNWWTQTRNEDTQVRKDTTEDTQVRKDTTEDRQVIKDTTEDTQLRKDTAEDTQIDKDMSNDVQVKVVTLEDSERQTIKNEDFHSMKNRTAVNEVQRKASEWYIPVEAAEEKNNEVKFMEANLCRSLGIGTFADPRSCEQFIVCLPGDWLEHSHYVMTCPGGTRFDSNLKNCNYASSVDCHL